MMKILFSPQVNDKRIIYEFDGEIIRAEIGEHKDAFDFTGVPNGRLQIVDPESGDFLLENNLPVNPIISAEKKDGVLYVELLNWISEDASESDRFPDWIDASEYEPPAKEAEPVADELEGWDEF